MKWLRHGMYAYNKTQLMQQAHSIDAHMNASPIIHDKIALNMCSSITHNFIQH